MRRVTSGRKTPGKPFCYLEACNRMMERLVVCLEMSAPSHECRHALIVLSQLQTDLLESWLLSSKVLYRTLISGDVRNNLIGDVGVTNEEGRLLWLRASGMKCLNNDEASLNWLVIWNALWVGKRLEVSLECIWWVIKESVSHAFFYCLAVRPLCKLLEGYIARVLNRKFSSWKPVLCAAMWFRCWIGRNTVFFCLLGVMRVVIWTTRPQEFHEGESFFLSDVDCFLQAPI